MCTINKSVDPKKSLETYRMHLVHRKFILSELKLGHNPAKAIRNICCEKGEGRSDHNTVTR